VERRAGLDAGRVEALSDGVFAIVLTLLVFELKVPQVGLGAGTAELAAGLRAMLPQALGYLLSFFALGNFWIAHRGQFHYVRRTDRALLWINLLFFLFLTAVPFVTAFLTEYPGQPVPVVVYGIDLMLAALTLYAHWHYATHDARLLDAPISPALVRQQGRRILVGPVIYFVGIACAVVSPWISLALYLLVPVYYLLPGAVDRHWFHVGRGEPAAAPPAAEGEG
jgi:uncharacterized membrane protein